jgi:N-acetylglutamate synthase-like GNAT family acetyltransferase
MLAFLALNVLRFCKVMPTIRDAQEGDRFTIRDLLLEYDMQYEGVFESGSKYWVAEDGVLVVGAMGLELGQGSVLLRSAIVAPSYRGKGLGQKLTEHALSWARDGGYRNAYCFSTNAGGYWIARGFQPCSIEDVVRALPTAPQVELFGRLGWLPTEEAFQLRLGEAVVG